VFAMTGKFMAFQDDDRSLIGPHLLYVRSLTCLFLRIKSVMLGREK